MGKRIDHSSGRLVGVENGLRLLIELSSRRFGMDWQEIINLLETSRRNAYRYMKALEEAGVRIEKKWEPTGRTAPHRIFRLLEIRGHKLTRIIPQDP